MKRVFRLPLVFMLVVLSLTTAQAQRLPLNKSVFKKEIRDSAWFMADSTKSSKAEIFILSFARDTLAVAYLNLLEGGSGSFSTYDCRFSNNFMEVKARKWQPFEDSVKFSDMPPMLYLYGYRSNTTDLMILFSPRPKKMDDALLQEKDWLLFKQVQ